MPERKDFESIFPKSRKEFRSWLSKNHTRKEGVWLILGKKGTPDETFPVIDAICELLCFGWIDSLPNKIDATTYKLFVSPRKPKSKWSAVNKKLVSELTEAGLMTKAGAAMIELAKQTGTWEALSEVDALIIPNDLKVALQGMPPAYENFVNFPKSTRRGILEWILNAKRPETRKNRIEETATLAKSNLRANQYTKK